MHPEQKTKETRRRRLVINLDKRRSASAIPGGSERRWPKVLTVLAILVVTVVILAAVGALVWWQYYKTTPAYSLALLVDAAHRNDLTVVDQILDVDKIVADLASSVTETALGRYGVALSSPVRSRVETLVPSLLPGVRQSVRDLLVKRVREIAERAEHKPFVVVAISLPYLVNFTTEAGTARVTGNIRDQPIDLTMRTDGQRWRVVAVKDDLLAQRTVDLLIKDLPAIGQQLEGIEKQLRGLLPGSKRKRR
jgi:hypothetical protein